MRKSEMMKENQMFSGDSDLRFRFLLSSLSSTTSLAASLALRSQDAWGSGTRVDGKKAQQFEPLANASFVGPNVSSADLESQQTLIRSDALFMEEVACFWS